jgi:hypothetical protein
MGVEAGKLGTFTIGAQSSFVVSVGGGQGNLVVAFDTHPTADPFSGNTQIGLQVPPGVRINSDGSLTYLVLVQNVDVALGDFDLCFMLQSFWEVKMKTHLIVLHDANGKILSLGEIPAAKPKGLYANFAPGSGEAVLELERTKELAGKKLTELHRDFQVDVTLKKLVKR